MFVTLFHVWIHLSGKFIFLEEVVPFAPFQLHCQTLPIQQEQINKWNRHVIYWHGQHVPCSQGGQIQCSFKDVYLCKCTYHVSKIAGSKVILQITYKLNSINDLMDWMKTMPKTKYLQTQQPVLTCRQHVISGLGACVITISQCMTCGELKKIAFTTVFEIHGPNFMTRKIWNPGPKNGWNHHLLQLHDL